MNISMTAVLYSGAVMFGIFFSGLLCIGSVEANNISSDTVLCLGLLLTYGPVVLGASMVRYAGNIGKNVAMNSAIVACFAVTVIEAVIVAMQVGGGFEAIPRLLCSPGTFIQLAVVAGVAYASGKPVVTTPTWSNYQGQGNAPSGASLIDRLEESNRPKPEGVSQMVSNMLGIPDYCPNCGVPLKDKQVKWIDTLTAACPVCNAILTDDKSSI